MEMDKRKTMCVVFDIDETLIQFINSKYRARVWDILPDAEKAMFSYVEKDGHIIIFRPGLRELFAYFNGNRPLIQVGLWTYSNAEYCKDIANEIIKYAGLPSDFFLFRLSDEDMTDYPKDLNVIYEKFPYLSSFNTFIVDDLYKNITHNANKENCVIVQPFAPFSVVKEREPATEMSLRRSYDDDVFQILDVICKKVRADIEGCDSADIDDLVRHPEPVFCTKRIKRMGLQNFLKKYATKTISLLTIGDAHQSPDFFEVDDAGSRGGARKTRRRTRRNKKSKSKSKSRALHKTQRQQRRRRTQKKRKTHKTHNRSF
jgi:hypothetical protein